MMKNKLMFVGQFFLWFIILWMEGYPIIAVLMCLNLGALYLYYERLIIDRELANAQKRVPTTLDEDYRDARIILKQMKREREGDTSVDREWVELVRRGLE